MSLEHLQANLLHPQVCPNPIFIIGAPRSGTTILAESLARHSGLWASEESEVLLDLFGRGLADKAFARVSALKGGSWLRKQGVERSEFLGFLGLGLNALFTSRSQGKRWVDHTNLYTLMADVLADMYPGAFFIHVLRDGRRVVNSTLHFANRFSPQDRSSKIPEGRIAPWAADFTEACKVWAQYVTTAMDFAGRRPDRCLTLVNEEMIAEPKKQFLRLFEFIGVAYEDAPAGFFQTHRINTSFPELYKNPSATPRLHDPWNEWSQEQKQIFLERAGETMVRSGRILQQELDSLATLAKETPRPEPARQIQEIVDASLPHDARVVVVSKGDEELVLLNGRQAWHFPQDENGDYAGHHPGDSAEAIAQLEALRAKGGDYLLLPSTAFWWLDYYGGLCCHLDTHYRRVWDNEHCIVYQLSQGNGAASAS
ncbi:MAG: sulfotransferase family protein [Gemmataceae bacterium]